VDFRDSDEPLPGEAPRFGRSLNHFKPEARPAKDQGRQEVTGTTGTADGTSVLRVEAPPPEVGRLSIHRRAAPGRRADLH